ncbi:MAG: protein translocase subunit SecF [Alphaproteobacteria bacterium]|nr:protein translocase subunit SecF [Alphaproteobacteria bacterium]
MAWPLIKYLPARTNFKFVPFAAFAAFLSIAAVLATFASVFSGGFRHNPVELYQSAPGSPMNKLGVMMGEGFNLGIDFRGGTSIEVRAPEPIDLERLRAGILAVGVGDVQVQGFENTREAVVRFEVAGEAAPPELMDQVQGRIRAVVPGVEFTRIEVVGPKVSGELFTGGLIALGLAILLMLIYIAFRFETVFGLGAVLALFHDTILTLGLFSITRLEFTLTIIAALLTIIGYSMNDTVVVFDRLRENLRKFKRMPLGDVVDLSINETLSRTIITGCTALLALIGLLVLGGEALQGFAIAMIFGIVIGTYSSVYVAAPAILLWGVKRGADAPADPALAERKG